MYLKFQNHQHPNIELYFIQNEEFVETIPMDLTSFIVWHIENNRDLSDFFNKFNNLETTNILSEKISRFIKYLHIHETAESLLTTSQVLNQFIQNQKNITRNEISEQIINCFANLEFEHLLIATKRNNLIWNYLTNKIQNSEQILQYQPISFENERHELIQQINLSFSLELIYKFIYSLDKTILKTSNLLWNKSKLNPESIYLSDQNKNIKIEIDHKNRDIWISNSIWEFIFDFIPAPNMNEENLSNLFRIYFMTNASQLNTLSIKDRRLKSDSAFFNPLWLKAPMYTPKKTGEYAIIHWDIIKQELNVL